jgi:hypothetical protein
MSAILVDYLMFTFLFAQVPLFVLMCHLIDTRRHGACTEALNGAITCAVVILVLLFTQVVAFPISTIPSPSNSEWLTRDQQIMMSECLDARSCDAAQMQRDMLAANAAAKKEVGVDGRQE